MSEAPSPKGPGGSVIVRPGGPTTIEDLERENRALLKAQVALASNEARSKRQLELTETECQKEHQRADEAQHRVESLERELRAMSERLTPVRLTLSHLAPD